MSRIIKFRAWRDREMVEFELGDLLTDKNEKIIDFRSIPVMQFTGLKDKNGKEIYEGDIIRCLPSKEFYREVVFHFGRYLLINHTSGTQFPLGVVNSSHDESEIIGNIYEHPHLLNPQQVKK